MKLRISKEDRKVLKEFDYLCYPRDTHLLRLDLFFDYYGGMVYNLLSFRYRFLKWDTANEKMLPPEETDEDVIKIKEYIERNKANDYGIEMKDYWDSLTKIVEVLKKYYPGNGY